MTCTCFFCRAERRPELFEAYALLRSNYSVAFVSAKTKVSKNTLTKIKREWRLPVKEYVSKSAYNRMQAMLSDGCSYREVANTVGADPGTVAKWFPGKGFTKEQQAERSRLAVFERRLNLA